MRHSTTVQPAVNTLSDEVPAVGTPSRPRTTCPRFVHYIDLLSQEGRSSVCMVSAIANARKRSLDVHYRGITPKNIQFYSRSNPSIYCTILVVLPQVSCMQTARLPRLRRYYTAVPISRACLLWPTHAVISRSVSRFL